MPTTAKHIAIMAHSYGGVVVVDGVGILSVDCFYQNIYHSIDVENRVTQKTAIIRFLFLKYLSAKFQVITDHGKSFSVPAPTACQHQNQCTS